MPHSIFHDIALIVIVSSVAAWISLFIRQPIIVGYILAGIIAGPWGLGLIHDINLINESSHIGITLLLFLAGLALEPGRIISIFRKSLLLTIVTGAVFNAVFMGITLAFGFGIKDALITGTALMFSSTILVIKLLPTTTLHQKHMGSLSIAVLILQDIVAVTALIMVKGDNNTAAGWLQTAGSGILLTTFTILAEKYIIRKIIAQIEFFHELLYLFTLAWSFAVALAASSAGLSHEIGAFIAGVALARNPIALFLLEGLRFFRDFFLVLFFFSLGAQIDFSVLRQVLVPGLVITLVLLLLKPAVYYTGFRLMKEPEKISRELGMRLGQASEFSLIIALITFQANIIRNDTFQLMQLVTILTMIISSFAVVLRLPTPLASSSRLKAD